METHPDQNPDANPVPNPDQYYDHDIDTKVDRMLGSPVNYQTLASNLSVFENIRIANGDKRLAMICGPANSVYANMLAKVCDIPVRYDPADNNPGEARLELRVGYYQPSDLPLLACDHTYIRYYNGKGQISIIDTVYSILWQHASIASDSIKTLVKFNTYPADDFDNQLAQDLELYPYNASTPQAVWQDLAFASQTEVEDCEKQLNSLQGSDWPTYWRDAAQRQLGELINPMHLAAYRHGGRSYAATSKYRLYSRNHPENSRHVASYTLRTAGLTFARRIGMLAAKAGQPLLPEGPE